MNMKQIALRDAANEAFNTVHDVMVEFKENIQNQEVWEIVESLPDEIYMLAYEWGWNDTEVGEKIYVFLKEEKGWESRFA